MLSTAVADCSGRKLASTEKCFANRWKAKCRCKKEGLIAFDKNTYVEISMEQFS
jgi:hypothetical protein